MGFLIAWVTAALAAVAVSYFSLILGALRYYSLARFEALLAGEPDRLARLKELLQDEERLVLALYALRGLTSTVGLVALTAALVARTIGRHDGLPLGDPWAWPLCGLQAVGLGTLLFVALGQTVPRAIGEKRPEAVLERFLPIVHSLSWVVSPLLVAFQGLHRLTLRVANVAEPDEAEERKHEILSAALAGESQGVMDTTTVEVIKNVMQFRDVAVTEVMTQRMNIVAVDVKDDIPALTRKAAETEFSRFPVTDGGLDKIVGVLVVKDLLRAAGKPGIEPRTLYRPAYFVPETKRVADLLKELRTKKVHMAFVADEYGGTAGLVTIEDVIEEIIGEIDDEHDGAQTGEARPLRRLSETELDVDGKLTLEELAREAGVRLPDVEEVSTLGGFVAMRLGRIPTKGDRVTATGHTFTVTDADERRARRLHVKLVPTPAHSPNE